MLSRVIIQKMKAAIRVSSRDALNDGRTDVRTEEDPCHTGVSIVPILVRDVAKGQEVKLHESLASSGIDGE